MSGEACGAWLIPLWPQHGAGPRLLADTPQGFVEGGRLGMDAVFPVPAIDQPGGSKPCPAEGSAGPVQAVVGLIDGEVGGGHECGRIGFRL
jgi:hypothetical protein